MTQSSRKPCKECPFRRDSRPGYTGEATPTEFLKGTLLDAPMPCHMSINYDDPEWKAKWMLKASSRPDYAPEPTEGRHCSGAATFFANMGKVSRDRERPTRPRDIENVFIFPQEFADHHGAELPAPYLRLDAEKLEVLLERIRNRKVSV